MRRRPWGRAVTPCVLAALAASGSPACRPATSPPPPQTVAAGPAALTPGERAFLDGRLDQAAVLLREGRRDSSDDLLRAYALLLAGDEPAAGAALEEAMRAPLYADPGRFRALLSLLTGRLDRAIAELTDAGGPRPFFNRVLAVEAQNLAGRYDAAQAEVDALAREFPSEPLVPHARGHLATARGQWSIALAAYMRSAQLGGPNPDLADGIAAAQIALGRYVEAREAIDGCRAVFPDYAEILYQAIRLERARPGAAGTSLAALASEYRSRSRRKDRVDEVGRWARGG